MGLRTLRRTRRIVPKYDDAINKDFGTLKIAMSTRGISRFADAATISALHSSDNVNKFGDTGLQLTDLLRQSI